MTQVDIGQLLETHEGGIHIATIGVHPYSVRIPFGVIEPEDGRVVHLIEEDWADIGLPADLARARGRKNP